jgi:hypothetical protein
MDWPARRIEPRHERERSRVTVQLKPAEKKAIDWLARLPEPFRTKLPVKFRPFARLAARTIARELSGAMIRELAKLHAAASGNN